MNFQHHVAPLSHHPEDHLHQSSFDLESWQQSYPHLSASTFGTHSDIYGAVAYQGNSLGLISDHRDQHRGSDRTLTHHIGFASNLRSSHQEPSFPESHFPSNEVATDYNIVVEDPRYYTGQRDGSAPATLQQYWEFSDHSSCATSQDAGHYPSHLHHQISPNSTLSNSPYANESPLSSFSQLQGYQTNAMPQMDQSHLQLYSQLGGNTQPVHQQHFSQSSHRGASQSHLAKSANEFSTTEIWANNVVPESKRRDPPTTNANRIPARTSSPARRKPVVLGWPPVESHQNKGADRSTAASGSPRATTSTANRSLLPRVSPGRSSPTGRQRAVAPSHAGPTQSVLKLQTAKKTNPEKKQTLACLFCRERKIACGRPPEGSADETCNQCARRHFKCEYPKESRRGQHKRNKKKGHSVNDAK